MAGRPIPTKRQTAKLIEEMGKTYDEEVGLRTGKIDQEFKEYQNRGLSVQQAKERIRDKWGNPQRTGMDKRAFFTWADKTRSYLEFGQREWRMGGHYNNDTKKWEAPEGGYWEDMSKTQDFINFLHGNSEAYGNFSQRLPRLQAFRLPRGGGPKMEEYLQSEENPGKTVTVQDADGNERRVTLGSRNAKVADLLADSEAFQKTIRQMDDPGAIRTWRPEHFEEMAKIHADLTAAGIDPESQPAFTALRSYIQDQSRTLAGRSNLQALTGAAEEHIDKMFGKGYVMSVLDESRPRAVAPARGTTEPPETPPEAGAPARPRPPAPTSGGGGAAYSGSPAGTAGTGGVSIAGGTPGERSPFAEAALQETLKRAVRPAMRETMRPIIRDELRKDRTAREPGEVRIEHTPTGRTDWTAPAQVPPAPEGEVLRPTRGGGAPGNTTPPPDTRSYRQFTNEDFGRGGQFPPPDIPSGPTNP
jgi:hypothetical protein